MQGNGLTLILFLLGSLLGTLAAYVWRRRSVPGATAFGYLLFAMTIYTIGYGMELASLSQSIAMIWVRIEYLGIAFIPAIWLIFIFQYSGKESWLTRRNIVLLFTIPVITLTLVYTNDFHHFYYHNVTFDTNIIIPTLAFDRGLWYWVNAAYMNFAFAFGVLLLWRTSILASWVYRSQVKIITTGSLTPVVIYLAYLFLPEPARHIDLNPFAFVITGLATTWGLFRRHLLDLAPIARDVLIENLRDGVLVLDTQQRAVDINPAGLKIFGWSALPTGQASDVIWKAWPDILKLPLDEQPSTIEIQQSDDTETRFFEFYISPLKNQPHTNTLGWIIIIHDITLQKKIEHDLQKARDATEWANYELSQALTELERLAATDKLTGAYNRRKFDEIINYEIKRVKRYHTQLSLIMFDIDHFKLVNDQYGHQAGDQALIELVQLINSNVRGSDSLFRWGGEEFMLLAPGINLDQVFLLADKLCKLVAANEFTTIGHITISLGVAEYHTDETLDQLIGRADSGMYCAKDLGRNRVEIGCTSPLSVTET